LINNVRIRVANAAPMSSAITPNAPGNFSRRQMGHGLIISNKRKRIKAIINK
jgi:hypothetical protein